MPKVAGYQAEGNLVGRVIDNESDADFKHVEPGFSLAIDSIGSLAGSDKGKIFG